MRRQDGLTLLEMLVVLLIASMAISLGYQSLGQWQRANAAISSISGATQQATLTEYWFESSLRSLIPLQEVEFQGARDRLSGIATQPTQSHQGGATGTEWSTRHEGANQFLTLVEDGKQLDLPLPGVVSATFGYLDKEGRTHDQWPPKLGLHDHLPAVILLRQEMDDGTQRIWAANIAGAHNPRFNPFEADLD
ncbi:PulJ/GspJ family protein [Stenotrophomonas nitritireducens]|uniref:PulJ/GspJ family protein n=1 Tax=Stenotrophomonas nitritireducens TaxID=83617 RepID=UPI003D96FB8A